MRNMDMARPFYMATMAQMKELDRRAIEERGIPSLELMENAAKHVVKAACERVERRGSAKRAAIFCAPGNNGGDGIAAARLLMAEGYEVRCFLSGSREKMTADSRANEERLIAVGGALEDLAAVDDDVIQWVAGCGCIIDALFGVGLARNLEGVFADIVELINSRKEIVDDCVVVSCDIPSGVNGDTGKIMGVAVKPDVTVTFSCAKPGLFGIPGMSRSHRVSIVDIGIPEDLYAEVGISAGIKVEEAE